MGILAFTPSAFARGGEGAFLSRAVAIGGATYNFKVFVPQNWTKKKKWPVILFLHGAGERGDDNITQTEIGLGPVILRRSEAFPFVVVMPQCPKNRWWPEPEMQQVALGALDLAMKEFNGDNGRVYLTGLSMGGYGTWAIAVARPGRFAALAPVCGGIRRPPRVPIPQGAIDPEATGDPYELTAKRIGRTPVWAFHGAADPVVPVAESRRMAEALKAAGGDVRYTEYESVSHNSWDRAYAEPEFFNWLLAHRASDLSRKMR
jgi:predicted peptidase